MDEPKEKIDENKKNIMQDMLALDANAFIFQNFLDYEVENEILYASSKFAPYSDYNFMSVPLVTLVLEAELLS